MTVSFEAGYYFRRILLPPLATTASCLYISAHGAGRQVQVARPAQKFVYLGVKHCPWQLQCIAGPVEEMSEFLLTAR